MVDQIIDTRLALKSDYQLLLEICEDVFEGGDYLPGVFLQWLNDASRLMIAAEKNGEMVGVVVLHIVDAGKTVIHQALRVHPKYRGQGIGTTLAKVAQQYIGKLAPSAEIERWVAGMDNPQAMAVAEKCLFTRLLVLGAISFDASLACLSETSVDLSAVISLTKDEFTKLIEDKKLNDVVDKNVFVCDFDPFETHPSNVSNGLWKDNDFVYVSTESSENTIQCLSHGRLAQRVKILDYVVTIYTTDLEHLKKHVVSQVRSANMHSNGKPYTFYCFFYKSLTAAVKTFVNKELLVTESSIVMNSVILYQKELQKDHI